MNPFDQFDSEPAAAQPAANPFDQFDGKEKKQNKGILADFGTDLKRGIENLPGAVTGLLDIPAAAITGEAFVGKGWDKVGQATGFQPSKWAKEAEAEYSPERQAVKKGIDATWEDNADAFDKAKEGDLSGVGEIAKTYLQNPAHAIGGSVVESVPSMLAGGVVGRGILAAAPKLAPAIAGGVGEGAIMSGQQMTDLVGNGVDDRTAAGYASVTGLAGGAIGAVGGKVAGKLGVIDPDTAIAGGVARSVAGVGEQTFGQAAKETAKRIAGGAVSEGVFEELPQSIVEQGMSNLAQGKQFSEGLVRAGVEGTLAGMGMGGAFNALPAKKGDSAAADSDFAKDLNKTLGGDPGAIPTLVTDLAPIQQRIDSLFGIGAKPMDEAGRAQYAKDIEAAFGEVVGYTAGKDGLEIPFTIGDYLNSSVRSADITRDKPKAEGAVQASADRLQQLAEEEVTQQADIAQLASGIAALPSIPVNGPLSKTANEAIQSGAAVIAPAIQSAAPVAAAAQAPNAGPLAKAASEAAPNIPATVAPAAPNIQDQAPNIEQAQAATSAIDLTGRNEMQLNYLAKNGKTGYKEAAIAELQRRGVSAAPSAIPNGDGVTSAPDVAPINGGDIKQAAGKKGESASTEDSIGWTRMTTVEREGLLIRAGYGGTGNRRLNLGGAGALNRAWDKMGNGLREKLVAAHEARFNQTPIKSEAPGAATIQAEPVAQDQNQIKNQKPATRQNKGPAGRDDLVGAILRITGGKGIASKMSPTIIGDTANNATKVRGLFTNDGTFDLDDAAELLRTEEGFDVRDGNHLSELIREQASGERIYSMERTEREATDNAEKQHRDEVRKQAKKLGVKTVARKFSAIEEEVFRRMEQRHNEAVAKLDARAKSRFDAMLRHAVELADYDEVDAIIADAQSRFIGREFYSQATKQLRGYIDDLTIERQAQEQTNANEEQQGTSAEPDWLKDEGFGTEGSGIGGTAVAAPEEARSESGQQGRAETGLTLEGQTNEQAAEQFAQQKAAKAKEAADKKAADEKAKADSEANDFRLAGSDRAADVAVAGGQVGLFGANGQPTKDAAQQSQPKTDTTQKPGQDKENQSASEMDALKAEMGQAIGELASILGAKLNLTPEEESKIIPVMSKIFRIAAKMGYIKFKDAARYVLEQIRKMAGDDVADKISIDNLQAGYINIAKEIGGDKREAMSYDSIEDLEKANVIDERSGTDLERDSGNAGSENGMGQEGVRAGRNGDGRAGRQGVEGAAEDGGQRSGVSRGQDEAAAAGERGNIEIYTGAPELSPGSAGNSVDFGSRDSGIDGLPVEPDAAKATQGSATSPVSLGAKQAKQREADKAPHKPGIDAIRQALPILTENQQDDVAKAEERFAVPDGYGMLFTNGTGTGKTFTGLGVIKRFANAGKKNILVVAPNDKIIEDWQKSGKLLGLELSRLEDTNDAGSGIVITTYANMGQNNELASRSWDLIVHDEAHYLAMDKDGTNTNALKNLRALSMHPDGAYQRHAMINAEGIQRLAELDADAKMQRMSDDQRMWTLAEKTQAEADKLRTELKAKQDAIKEEVEASQGADRTRALFLSATPFAYEKTIDWANGYIFDYNEGRGDESKEFRGYNTGSNRDQFFMQHFGYRMRYGKLTQPDAKVDSGLMQRQFNSWLKKKGSLSGRMLDVSADYDRRFILVDSAIGSRIDEALQWFEVKRKAQNQGTGDAGERIGAIMAKADPYAVALGAVRDYIGEKFDYLSRRYLLESIKAREVVPHVREHLALGRKVVVFHDYKKGGGFNPFILEERTVKGQESDDGLVSAAEWNKVVREFNGEFRDIINSDLFRQSSPIEMFKDEFPGVLLFNGDVPAKTRRENVAKFQDDASGPQVILVQSAAGKEGISLHDTTGKHQRVLFNLGQPTQPTTAIQQEGRIYRTGQVTDAIFRYLNTGTNWEKWAFATTIAQRASAAENLGMGEMARALKDAFISGFEESDDYRAGMDGEGKGGKERDKAANDALTEYDRARAFYFGTQKKTSKTKAQEGADYFATPEPVGLKMVEFADIRPGERVLEPSAGHGAIARWIPDTADKTAIEPSMVLRSRLAMVFDGTMIDSDFESMNVVNKFDAIVMNPPFGSGGKMAVDHLAKAASHLRDGGRIVALLPTGPAADKKFEKWMYEGETRPAKPLYTHPELGPIFENDTLTISAFGSDLKISGPLAIDGSGSGPRFVRPKGEAKNSAINLVALKAITPGNRNEIFRPADGIYLVSDIKMPAVTFERAGTKVMTRIVVLEKSSDPKTIDTRGVYNRDFTSSEDINDLFDQMENMALPNRAKAYEQEAEQAAPGERSQKAKPAPANVGDVVTVNGNEYAIEIYTTNDGKDKRGIWMEEKEAKEINPRAFKSSKMRGTPAEGKFFVDEYWLNKAKDKAGPGNVAATGTISVADKAIYGMAAEGKSAAEILRFIASASRSPFNRQLAKLLMKTGIAPSIEAGDSKGWKFNAGEGNRYAAAYNPKTDSVALFRPAAAERNVLHELVHAATLKALAKRGMASGQMAVLFAHVKKTGKLKGMYGMSDIDEFVAEAFTNPKFQEALKKIDAPMSSRTLSSAWQWFIRTVRGILGLPADQENALSQALDIGLAVMRDDMALRKEQSPAADVPFAEISGKEIDKALGRTIQEKATNWMRINLQGKSFKNEITGWDISVGRKGINKAMSHGGKDTHARSVAAIPELLKNAVLVATEPNRNERQSIDIKSVHHFYAPLRIDGKEYVARMVVKEARNGQFFYDYDTSDEINPAESMVASEHLPKEESASAPSIPKEWGEASSAGLSISMAKLMSYVKAEHGGTDPKFIRYAVGQNQTGSAAFRKWFGDSKVVDANGEPLVVYHGSPDVRGIFADGFRAKSRGNVFFAAANYAVADSYADDRRAFDYQNAEPQTIPLYLSIKNPMIVDAKGAFWKETERHVDEAKAAGHDGIIIKNSVDFYNNPKGTGKTTTVYAWFSPTQAKSAVDGQLVSRVDRQPIAGAIGNNGDFDGSNPDIRYNIADEGAWSVSEPSKMDDVIYSLQDKHVDTRRVVQAIAKTGKEISDKSNPYLQEELFHGRAAKGVKDFLDFELRPLLAKMQLAKIDMGDFEEYLWNRHAEERNKQIAKINPEMKDGGSGIKTADARAFLAGIDSDKRSVLESLAKMVDGMNKSSQRVLVESGLETQETIDAWNGAYKHYVPLQREDVDSGNVGTGKGFSIRGSSTKRAMGSGRAVVDIIANLTMQRERNIVRAEKNRVSNALLGLAVQNPNPDFWTVDKAPKERVVEEKAIYTVTDEAGNATEFTRMDDAEKFARSLPGAEIEQTWGDRVTERIVPGFSTRDNVLLTRINGKDHYITFNERDERAMRMVQSLKNLDADNMGRVLSIVGKATRYLASINTQYNPVFGVINLIRDAQGALINLSSTPLAGDQKRVFGYTLDALRGIYADIRAHRKGDKPSSSWAKLFEEFQNEGGQTGYRDQYENAEQRAEAIRSELDQFKEGKVKQLTRGVFGWLSDYNETMENAVRLATYKAAKERGLSNQKAASLAKNITVNFNRKGQMATQVGALYAFFNASVQGSARLAETLFESKDGDIKTAKLSKAGKKIVMGGIMLGSMQALLLAAAGFGDDEPPEFVRERNLILPIGEGKYLTLAMPLGFHVIPGIGRIATEFVMGGGKDPIKHMAAFAGMFAESFNPIGSSGFSLQTITPSVVDPFAALAENRDFTGKEIYRKDFNALNPTPGHMRAKDVATFYSRWISEGLNFITGGTEFKPGMISWSPDSIDYLVAQAGGGVMREANKVFQTAGATYSGEDLPLYKIPLAGRFIGDTEGQSGQSAKFYDAIKKINMHEAEYKGLLKDGRRQEAMDYLAENPGVKLIMAGNHVESQVRKLRSMKREMVEKDAGADQVREIDARITATMKKFNERAASVTGGKI